MECTEACAMQGGLYIRLAMCAAAACIQQPSSRA